MKVNQKTLAERLGLTTRRCRQLVAENILPEADDDGFDVDKCAERYSLYATGSETAWDRFYAALEADADRLDRLIKAATTRPKAGAREFGKVGPLFMDVFDRLRFAVAAQGGPARHLMLELIGFQARDIFAPVYDKAQAFIEKSRKESLQARD